MEIQRSRLIIALGLLFALGIVLAVSNAYCSMNMGRLFAPFLYGVALIALTTGAAIALMFQWKIDKIQLDKVIGILPEDEKLILGTLVKRKRIEQNHLTAETGLSSVQVSRTLSKLEQRGIVDKKPYGNTNLIILKL